MERPKVERLKYQATRGRAHQTRWRSRSTRSDSLAIFSRLRAASFSSTLIINLITDYADDAVFNSQERRFIWSQLWSRQTLNRDNLRNPRPKKTEQNKIIIHYESEFKTDLEEDYRHHHHHPHRTRHIHYNDKLHRQLIIVESVECRVERQWRAALDSWELFEWRVL